jgi:hypothetical protein
MAKYDIAFSFKKQLLWRLSKNKDVVTLYSS